MTNKFLIEYVMKEFFRNDPQRENMTVKYLEVLCMSHGTYDGSPDYLPSPERMEEVTTSL